MDIVKLLPEYLDLGVDAEEMQHIALAALARRIRDLKLAIAEAVMQARACTLMDNLDGSNKALQQARHLQREYHHFYTEWRRLGGEGPGGSEEEPGGQSHRQSPDGASGAMPAASIARAGDER